MITRLSSTLAASGVALAVLGGSVLFAGGAALASPDDPQPGDATAVGGEALLDVSIPGIIDYQFTNQVGSVYTSVLDEKADFQEDAELVDAGVASITLGTSATASRSTTLVAQAASDVTDTSFNLFGISLVSLDNADAAATCPVGGPGAATVSAEGLRILGIPVTLTDAAPGAQETVSLDDTAQVGTGPSDQAGETADLTGLDLTVRVAKVVIQDDDGAVGISLAATATLEGSYQPSGAAEPIALEPTVVASLVLAGAQCLVPADLTITGVSPASGSTAGGETITLTGTGFDPDSTVTVGGAPATNVVIDPTGTSLTATTPAGTAGATTIVVTTSDDRTASVPFTYIAPVVPVKPVTPASTGTTTLAATGADPMPGIGIGAGVLGLGLVTLLVASARRRRA